MQIPNLRYWRERRALTQVELAENAGISERSVAGYESGAGARPGYVRKLAQALQVDVSALLAQPEASGVDAGQAVTHTPKPSPTSGDTDEERRYERAIAATEGLTDALGNIFDYTNQRVKAYERELEDQNPLAFKTVATAQLWVEHLQLESEGLTKLILNETKRYAPPPRDPYERGAHAVALLRQLLPSMNGLSRLRTRGEERIKAMADAPNELKSRIETRNRQAEQQIADELEALEGLALSG